MKPSTFHTKGIIVDNPRLMALEHLYSTEEYLGQTKKIVSLIDDNNSITKKELQNVQTALKEQMELIERETQRKIEANRRNTEKVITTMQDSTEIIVHTMQDSTEIIVRTINEGFEELHRDLNTIGYKLDQSNKELAKINLALAINNNILNYLNSQINELIELIKNPREVEALELVNQARLSLSIHKNRQALQITTEAMKLAPTSIPVLAFHIIALSAQKENNLDKVVGNIYDLIKLIDVGLISQESLEIRRDALSVVYPLVSAVSSRYGSSIMEQISDLYNTFKKDEILFTAFIFRGLADSRAREMIDIPTGFREFHLKTAFDAVRSYQLWKSNDYIYYDIINYFGMSLINVKSPLAYAFLLSFNKFLYRTGILRDYLQHQLITKWVNEKENIEEGKDSIKEETLDLNLFVLPPLSTQHYVDKIINLSFRLYPYGLFKYNAETLALIDMYKREYQIKPPKVLLEELEAFQAQLKKGIGKIIQKGKKIMQSIRKKENNLLAFINDKMKKFRKNTYEYGIKTKQSNLLNIIPKLKKEAQHLEKELKNKKDKIKKLEMIWDNTIMLGIMTVVLIIPIIAIIMIIHGLQAGDVFVLIANIIYLLKVIPMGIIAVVLLVFIMRIVYVFLTTIIRSSSEKIKKQLSEINNRIEKIMQDTEEIDVKIVQEAKELDMYVTKQFIRLTNYILHKKEEFISYFDEILVKRYFPNIPSEMLRKYSYIAKEINENIKCTPSNDFIQQIQKIKKELTTLYSDSSEKLDKKEKNLPHVTLNKSCLLE